MIQTENKRPDRDSPQVKLEYKNYKSLHIIFNTNAFSLPFQLYLLLDVRPFGFQGLQTSKSLILLGNVILI